MFIILRDFQQFVWCPIAEVLHSDKQRHPALQHESPESSGDFKQVQERYSVLKIEVRVFAKLAVLTAVDDFPTTIGWRCIRDFCPIDQNNYLILTIMLVSVHVPKIFSVPDCVHRIADFQF